VTEVSAAKVSTGDMGVSAAPTAAAATEASMSSSVSATMAAAVATSMAAATSAGGRERWGKGDSSAERCGSGDSDHGPSRHWGVILSGYPSTMRDVRPAI
jgi:hypothetical protein